MESAAPRSSTSESPFGAAEADLLARFEMEGQLAAGGFSDVYRARQRSTGQEVAIKLLRLDADPALAREQCEHFHRETQLCATLQHPNIVRLIDSGGADGAAYAVFEFVRGTDLADVLAAEGALEPGEALHLMGQALDALACAHAAGIAHGDLKPANVMITDTGARRNALVLDFGLAALTRRTAAAGPASTVRSDYLGTPRYAAPELLLGGAPSPEADLYAWGLMTIECLTGEPVYDGPTALIVHRQLDPEPVPTPPELAAHPLGRLLARVTEKDVAKREGSAREVFAALQSILAGPLPTRDKERRASHARAPRRPARERQGLSRIWQVPLLRNPNFTGREESLAEIETSFERSGLLALAALRGLGGVGKTQLALEFAYRHASDYDLVAWLRAERPEELAEDFGSLAKPLGLPEQDASDQLRRVEAVRGWLERNESWLLVFDNATNPDSIRMFLPRTACGHVLVTSRHQSWRELGISVCVEELPRDDAVAFLLHRTGDADRAAAIRLADELGCLPLALEGAAAYIETTGRTLREYLELVRERHQILLAGPKPVDYPATLGTTWEISFRQIETELPAAADLMRLCSFLAPDEIPLGPLREATDRLPKQIAVLFADPLAFDACVAALRRYSFVKAERDTLSMHRLVQLVTRERIPEADRLGWVERALRITEAGFPKGGMAGNVQPEARRMIPHALSALAHAEHLPACAISAGRLMNLAGNYLSALGFHDQARARLERALSLFEASGEDVDRHVANVLDDLGFVLLALGDTDPALRHGERAMEIHERLFGPQHPRIYLDVMKQAWILLSSGAFERARDHYERALLGIRGVFGADHPLEGHALAALSRVLFELGETAHAYETAARSVAILDKPELYHPLLLTAWTSLAQLALYRGDLDAAAAHVERGLAIGEAAYGEDHSLVAMCFSLRGAVEMGRGEFWKARHSLERSLLSGERTSKRLHCDIAIARSLLGDVLRRMGDRGQALAALRHAQRGLDRICGSRGRIEAHVETALGAHAFDERDLPAARSHGERALAALDASHSARHPFRIPALALLARVAEAEVALDRACELAEQALACGAEAFDGEHPDLIEPHGVLARIASLRSERERASLHASREAALRRRWRHAGSLAPARPGLSR